MMVTLQEANKRNLSIEDVDALTGTIIGRPKSATFRTADIVGLDVMTFVADTAYNKCSDDYERDIYLLPDHIKKLIDMGYIGQKVGAGFYKKVEKGEIHVLDLNSLEYRPINKKRFKAIICIQKMSKKFSVANTVYRLSELKYSLKISSSGSSNKIAR